MGFHPKKNWINDPNGLCYFNGKFHIYYQYNPSGINWGNISWGHATTFDFINYKEEEVVLKPDKSYDCKGCFSGSSVIKDGILYVYYTSNSNKQTQSVAYSKDGYNFTKYEGNPILELEEEFRDPYMFYYKNELYMLLGAQNRIMLYKSIDMFYFEFVSNIYELDDFPECPNIVFIDGKWILKYSSITTRDEHFLIGDFDGYKFHLEFEQKLDLPKNSYASQIFLYENKPILISWIYNNEYKTNESYNGCLSDPIELKFDGKLYFCDFSSKNTKIGAK